MTQRGESTRNEILDAALQDARNVGLSGVTIGRLADATSLSKSGLFAHFGSKEALQVAILDHAGAAFTERVVRPGLRSPRGVARLAALFDHWLAWGLTESQRGGCIFVASAGELDDREGPVRERLLVLQRWWIDLLAEVFRSAQREGQLRDAPDALDLAHELYGILLDAHHAARLLRDPQAVPRAKRLFDALLQRNLRT